VFFIALTSPSKKGLTPPRDPPPFAKSAIQFVKRDVVLSFPRSGHNFLSFLGKNTARYGVALLDASGVGQPTNVTLAWSAPPNFKSNCWGGLHAIANVAVDSSEPESPTDLPLRRVAVSEKILVLSVHIICVSAGAMGASLSYRLRSKNGIPSQKSVEMSLELAKKFALESLIKALEAVAEDLEREVLWTETMGGGCSEELFARMAKRVEVVPIELMKGVSRDVVKLFEKGSRWAQMLGALSSDGKTSKLVVIRGKWDGRMVILTLDDASNDFFVALTVSDDEEELIAKLYKRDARGEAEEKERELVSLVLRKVCSWVWKQCYN
jgi:hypothetical protein